MGAVFVFSVENFVARVAKDVGKNRGKTIERSEERWFCAAPVRDIFWATV